MKRFLRFAAPLALFLAACGDGSTNARAVLTSVSVSPGERTLGVGQTLQLTLAVRDQRGAEYERGTVAWTSENTAVATVSQTGLVTAVAPGTAVIRATVDAKSDAVTVLVAAAPPECSQPGAARTLAVGEALTLGGIQASVVCLSGGAAGAEFVAVPFNATGVSSAVLPVAFTTAGTVPVLPTSPALLPADAAFDLRPTQGLVRDEAWETAFRARSARELSRWVQTARDVARAREAEGGALRPSFALNTSNASVGQLLRINATVGECSESDFRTGRVVAVTQRAIVVADTANPPGGLTEAEYRAFGETFDTLVYPVVTAAFGEPGDLDKNNGRSVLFYTRAVNELTPPGSGSYVGGFFYSRDLFPTRNRDGLEACAGSNYAEIFYMLVPDPGGVVNSNPRSRDLVLTTSVATLAHEFQHLVNASRRLYNLETVNWNEEVWLNEGMSHIAEELVFYRNAGIAPRQNITAAVLNASPRLGDAFRRYMFQNFQRYDSYIRSAESQSPLQTDDDLGTRGAAWAFLRYAADRRGGDENQFWRALVDNTSMGLENLQRVLGTDARPLMRDWSAALFADDTVPSLAARHQQPSWHFRSFYGGAYGLQTRRLAASGGANLPLTSGSAAYLRFGVAPATVGTVRNTVSGAAPPSELMLTIIRTR